MSAVTAKIVLYSVENNSETTQLYFNADYADGRNKEWAPYTPGLSLSMSVKREMADKNFKLGSAYTLTFEENND